MVDFRIYMVGTPCQNDSTAAVLLHPGQGLLALLFHVAAGGQQLFPGGVGRHLHLGGGNLILFVENFYQLIGENLLIGEGHEGIQEADIVLRQLLHIVFDVLRVGSYHGAVVVVARIRGLVALVGDAGVEDGLHALADEPADMSVDQLGRVALGLAGDGLDAKLVNLPGGLGG